MSVLAGQSLTADFTVVGSTGALVNGDSLPTGTLVINGTDNAATVTVSNKATGIYKAAVTVPATVAIGDAIQIRVNATVSTVASGGYIFTGTVDASTGQASHVWYVRSTGSDSNHGRSTGAPKLTIAAAITAASSGDTIDIGAGNWTEQIDLETATKSLTIRGVNSTQTVITRTGTSNDTGGGADHVIKSYHNCTFEHLRLVQSATGDAAGQAIRAYTMENVTVRHCYLESNYDSFYVAEGKNWKVQFCELVSRYDCLNCEDSINGLVEDCDMRTTCSATYSDAMRCIILSGSVNVAIRRCYLSTSRSSSVAITNATYGIQGGQNYSVEDTFISVVNTDATNTANLGCIHGNSSISEIILNGVTFTTSNAGSGTTRHIRNGKFIDLGTNIDTTLVHATSTTHTIAYADARKWLGTTPQTPNTPGVPIVDASGISGTGARTVTITVNDGATALENAIVRMVEGANAYTQTTNASGVATFNLDDATYTVSISKQGYSYAGTTIVVNGTETATYSMTAITISAPADPALTAAYLTTYDAQGAIAGSTVISFKLKDGVGTTGYSYSTATFTGTSNASTGLLTINLVKSTSYSARRGNGEWVDFTTGSASTYALPEILGTL